MFDRLKPTPYHTSARNSKAVRSKEDRMNIQITYCGE